MTSREPSNSVVHRLVAAINDGDRDAFLATLTPHATLPAAYVPSRSLRARLCRTCRSTAWTVRFLSSPRRILLGRSALT
jgi:hypothetical protein